MIRHSLGGTLSARLYDKTVEAKKRDKGYLYPLWRAAGWDGERPVARLEFQLKSETLRELGVHNYADLQERLGGLWQYAATDWLRLTIPAESDGKRARWATHPLWEALAMMEWPKSKPVTRCPRPTNVPPKNKLIGSYISALSSYMAATGETDPYEAMHALDSDARAFRDRLQTATDEDFEAHVVTRAALKAKKWSVPFGRYPERAAQSQAEAAADAYRRAKEGR